MDTTDTESVDDESECPQQPYVDIEAVNSTLTEVHQQYNNLLLKYSNALNIIDELKCQLACGIGQGIAGARGEPYALGLQRDVHFLENDVRKREPLPPAVGKRNSDLVTSRPSGDRSSPRRRAILCASDVGRVLPIDNKQLLSTGESAVQPKNARESVREIEALGKPTSSCMGVILDPTNEFVSYLASVEEMPKPSSPPCANDSSRRGHSSHRKTAAVQPKYHQVAVVYPAQRSAELCTVGCCIAHSCCCCQHTAEHQKSIHHMEAPLSSCCFSAGLDAKLTHLSRKCLCSGTSAASDTALFKVSSALDIALKLAAELRKSSSSLLQQL
uniref:Uncharacterized protein n=1 Tax=Rhipicephalus pulchellus TaxID=72859 RepID=L7M5V8_RHIPC